MIGSLFNKNEIRNFMIREYFLSFALTQFYFLPNKRGNMDRKKLRKQRPDSIVNRYDTLN